MKVSFLVTLCSLYLASCSAQPSGEDWVELGATSSFDANSVIRQGETARIWLKDTDGRNSVGQKVWQSTLVAYELDCTRATSRFLAEHFVELDGHQGTPVNADATDVATPIVPGSTLDLAKQKVCR